VMMLLKSHPDRPLLIQADSTYVLNIFTDVLNGWGREGPVTDKGTELKNYDLINRIDELLKGRRDICWEWVEGHKGHLLNESADRLAGFARSQAKLGHWR